MESDNPQIAAVIRRSLEQFNVALPGTVYTDPSTDDLFNLFKMVGSAYWVAESEGRVIGGAGIYPTSGLPEGYVELVKLYVDSSFRSKGIGQKLILLCMEKAHSCGYTNIYLETLPELNRAVSLYERMGFNILTNSLGNSGHYACSIWAEREI